MTPEAQDLIKQLLAKDPKKRLGSRGAQEIKEHKFFKGRFSIVHPMKLS